MIDLNNNFNRFLLSIAVIAVILIISGLITYFKNDECKKKLEASTKKPIEGQCKKEIDLYIKNEKDKLDEKLIADLKQIQTLPTTDGNKQDPEFLEMLKSYIELKKNKSKEEYLLESDIKKHMPNIEKDAMDNNYNINYNNRLAGKHFQHIPMLGDLPFVLKECNKSPLCHGINSYNAEYEATDFPYFKLVYTHPANTENIEYYVDKPGNFSISKNSLKKKLLV